MRCLSTESALRKARCLLHSLQRRPGLCKQLSTQGALQRENTTHGQKLKCNQTADTKNEAGEEKVM